MTKFTSGLLSAVMVLTMIAEILPQMGTPVQAAPEDYQKQVTVGTVEELKAALASTEDSYITLYPKYGNSLEVDNDDFQEYDLYETGYYINQSNYLDEIHCPDGNTHYIKVGALWQSCLYYAFAVEGNHTLNLNGYSIIAEGDFQHTRADYVLFWVNQNDSGDEVVFTVENEPGKNDAPWPQNPEGKILLNTTNPEHLHEGPENDKHFDLNVSTSIFAAGLFGVPGKVVINSGYYESGTSRNDHQTYGSIVTLYENAELVVNGGQLVGRGDFYGCGTVRVGYRSKAVFNGGEIWGIGGAYAVVPVIYDGFVYDFRDTLDDSVKTYELFDYENDCPNSISYPQWTCWVKGYSCHKGSEEVVVNGGSFCFQKKFGKLGQFCPTYMEDDWKIDLDTEILHEDTQSFRVIPAIETGDIGVNTEYNGIGTVNFDTEAKTRTLLWNPKAILNLFYTDKECFYLPDFAMKELYGVGNIGGDPVRYTVSFWDNTNGSANLNGTPWCSVNTDDGKFSFHIDNLKNELNISKDPRNVKEWICIVSVTNQYANYTNTLNSEEGYWRKVDGQSNKLIIKMTDLPTHPNMTDNFSFDYDHYDGGESLIVDPLPDISQMASDGRFDDFGVNEGRIWVSVNGCDHQHEPYTKITDLEGSDDVTAEIKVYWGLADAEGNYVEVKKSETIPLLYPTASTLFTKTGDWVYTAKTSGTIGTNVNAELVDDYKAGKWYVRRGVDEYGEPVWEAVKTMSSIDDGYTVTGTGMYAYSLIRKSDSREFLSHPITVIRSDAALAFGSLTVSDYFDSSYDLNNVHSAVLQSNEAYIKVNPNSALQDMVDSGLAVIKLKMIEYPAGYKEYGDSYGKFYYSYRLQKADNNKVLFENFAEDSAAWFMQLDGGIHTYVAYAEDNNGNVLASSEPLNVNILVPYVDMKLTHAKTGTPLNGEWYLSPYESLTFNMEFGPDGANYPPVEEIEFVYTLSRNGESLDFYNEFCNFNRSLRSFYAKEVGTYRITVRAYHDGVQLGTPLNLVDIYVGENRFELTTKEPTAGGIATDAYAVVSDGAEYTSEIDWLTGTEYRQSPINPDLGFYRFITNEKITGQITLTPNDTYRETALNSMDPADVKVVIDGELYTGEDLGGWFTGTKEDWAFVFEWDFGYCMAAGSTELDNAAFTFNKPYVGDAIDPDLPGEDAFEGFTITEIKVLEVTEGDWDKDPDNDEGFTRGPTNKFQAGTTYRVKFTLESKGDEGFCFAPDMTVTINGSEAIKKNNGEGFYKVYAYYYFEPEIDPDRKAPMSGFKAPAISAPVTGKTPMKASSLSLKGVVGELETTDLYIAGMTWYIDANNNGMLDEGEGTAADFNEDGTFKANTVYRVQMAIALSNDADEDGEDDTTGFYLPQNTADIPDFPVALADGTTDTMDKEYEDAMLVYTYTFPATRETAGVTISGKVTSFGTGTTTVELLDENGNDAGFTPCTGTETEFTYTFTNV
ncbi:MAG: hypothetical protein IJF78_00335, partial [Clostridia bacterium]|nr:hypothetical protein [Clostridia bacterium]